MKYSFAYGGNDGVPFPVDQKAMYGSIMMVGDSVKDARLGDKDKLHSLQRLRRFVPESGKS